MKKINFGNVHLLYPGNLSSDDWIYKFLCLSSEGKKFFLKKVTKIISSLNLLLVYVLFFSHTIIEITVSNILNILSEQKNKTFSGVQLVAAENLLHPGREYQHGHNDL